MRKLRIVLIGCSKIGHVHAKAIKSLNNAELTAVYSASEKRAKEFAEKYNVEYYTSYEEVLKNKNIDIVDIVNTNNLHAPFVVKAANVGKHVIVEKPLAISVSEAKEAIESVKRNHTKLTVISQRRYDGILKKINKLVDSGKIGDVIFINLSLASNRTKMYYNSSNGWRKKKKYSGGGVLICHAIHYIDVINSLFGPSIEAMGIMKNRNTREVEDIISATIKMASGAVFTLNVTTAASSNCSESVEITGSKGSVRFENNGYFSRITNINLGNNSKLSRIKYMFLSKILGCRLYRTGKIKDQISDFIESIDKKSAPPFEGKEYLDTIKIVMGIYESSEVNKMVRIHSSVEES